LQAAVRVVNVCAAWTPAHFALAKLEARVQERFFLWGKDP
jgi:hypothetical protein